MSKVKYKFRDVSDGLRKLRDFLLGRTYVPNSRYLPLLSPRSLPEPDIPRGPEYKYSHQYYHERNVKDSVHPPIVAPIALGVDKKLGAKAAIVGSKTATNINFPTLPTPGCAYWWDAHCYYEHVHDFRPHPPKPKTEPSSQLPPCSPIIKTKASPDPCDPRQSSKTCK